MEYIDYYKTLGVDRGASQDEIKRAYRKLVRKYHPDVNTGDDAAEAEQKFKEAGEAYEVLKDPEKRAAYDQLGANWQDGQSFRPPPDWDNGFEFSGGGYTEADPDQFGSFFEDLFARRGGFDRAGGTRREYHAPGQDQHAKIVIDLDTAYGGGAMDFVLKKPELDKTGHVRLNERTIRVTIPKGMSEGQHIRLAEQSDWRFPNYSLSVVHRVRRLETDLGVNLAGIAVVLDLVAENAKLKRRVDHLEQETAPPIWQTGPSAPV